MWLDAGINHKIQMQEQRQTTLNQLTGRGRGEQEQCQMNKLELLREILGERKGK